MRQNLTDLTLRQLPHPNAGEVKYWDTGLPGFGVRLTARSKSFFVVRGKARQLTTIGKYPEISLADARKQAKRLLVQEPEKNATTRLVGAVVSYLEDIRPRVRDSTYGSYSRYLSNPPDIPLSKLNRSHIDPTSPHRVTAWKVFCNWCIRHELLDRNPFNHISVKYGKRSRVLTDEEVKIIMAYEDGAFSNILKLLILTGQRKTEIATLKPAWINGNTITIPASVAKNKNAHTFPFNLLTAKYLKQHQTYNGFSKGKARLDKLHPLPHWTIHDLRRTFSTIHARIGTPLHVTERLLNHVSGTISGVSAIYNRHTYMEEMTKATLTYELYIARLVDAEA